MDANELNELLKHGETQNVEIKGACAFLDDMRPHLAKSIEALANAPGGGTLVIGVENTSWTVQALRSSRRQVSTLRSSQTISRNVSPRFPVLALSGWTIPRGGCCFSSYPSLTMCPSS